MNDNDLIFVSAYKIQNDGIAVALNSDDLFINHCVDTITLDTKRLENITSSIFDE